jgi:hypothetical protein
MEEGSTNPPLCHAELTPSKYRTSLDCRLSVDGLKVLEDPLVVQLLTENELMLMEIEELRRKVRIQDVEIQRMRQVSCDEEAVSIREVEALMLKSDQILEELHTKDEKKVALLRPILETLARLQFETGYYVQENCALEEEVRPCRSSSCDEKPAIGTTLATHAGSQTLAEANARYEQLYHLIASYQATPSFMSSPYDALVLDALNHIIALSKTMSALVYASAEQESREGRTSTPPLLEPARGLTAGERPRSTSLWTHLTGR